MSAKEAAILGGLLRRDPQILNPFYKRLRQKVFSIFRNHYDAHRFQELDDCINEAFLKFLEKIQQPEFKAYNLEGYAFRVVQLSFKNYLKSKGRKSFISSGQIPEPSISLNYYQTDLQMLLEFEAPEYFWNWFQKRSKLEQQILKYKWKGYPLLEIAQELDLAYGTVRNKHGNLKKALIVLAKQHQ